MRVEPQHVDGESRGPRRRPGRVFRDRFEQMSGGEPSNASNANEITASRPSLRPRPARDRRRVGDDEDNLRLVPDARRREPLPPSGHGVSVAPTHAPPDPPRASSNPASVHVFPPSSLESTLGAAIRRRRRQNRPRRPHDAADGDSPRDETPSSVAAVHVEPPSVESERDTLPSDATVSAETTWTPPRVVSERRHNAGATGASGASVRDETNVAPRANVTPSSRETSTRASPSSPTTPQRTARAPPTRRVTMTFDAHAPTAGSDDGAAEVHSGRGPRRWRRGARRRRGSGGGGGHRRRKGSGRCGTPARRERGRRREGGPAVARHGARCDAHTSTPRPARSSTPPTHATRYPPRGRWTWVGSRANAGGSSVEASNTSSSRRADADVSATASEADEATSRDALSLPKSATTTTAATNSRTYRAAGPFGRLPKVPSRARARDA